MIGAGAVAGLTAYIDHGPCRVKRIRFQVIVFLEIRRMALTTHVIPVKKAPRPVKDMPGGYLLVRMEVKPSLPALLFRMIVPTDVRQLDTPVRKLNHILLQRIHAKYISYLVIMKFTVRTVRSDKEFSISLIKS